MSTYDLTAITRSYLERALREVGGMKVLLLDAETTRFASTVLSQSDILDAEVFLVDRLDTVDSKADRLPHLRALAFLRPTRENVARLRRELREPRFGSYHLYFTNRIDDMRLQDLAEGDTHELVASVQETYADFIALESHHAIVPLPRPYLALSPLASYDYGASTSDVIARLTEGVASLALALRRRFAVRYQKNSETAANLARSLHHLTNFEQRELFDFGNRPGEARPLLLILDRKDDPITPLLTQWTYQAMLHDILGLEDNRCSLRHVLGIRPELAEAVVSPSQDAFFKANMYANFGDAGMAVKQMVDAMGAETTNRNQPRDFQSIEDMASFVEALPDVTAQQGLTAKHVTLMTELSHAVENRQLMQVSGVEQEIACQTAAPERHFDAAAALIRSPAVRPFDKARLAALYALRYEGSSQASVLLAACADEGVDAQTMAALRAVAKYCGSETRVMDLFSDRSFTSRMATLAKQHLKGVENVYTQHTPPLLGVLERAVKGKLSDAEYPHADGRPSSAYPGSHPAPTHPSASATMGGGAGPAAQSPRLVLVFIVGGTTYEEAKALAELNSSGERGEGWAAGVKFLLAGTGVQNSGTFLGDLAEIAASERYTTNGGGRHVGAGFEGGLR